MARDEILDIFMDYTRDEGHSILLSSHIVSDLEKVCDYIAFLHRGKLMLCDEKDALLEKYGLIHVSREQLAELDGARRQGQQVLTLRRGSRGGKKSRARRDENFARGAGRTVRLHGKGGPLMRALFLKDWYMARSYCRSYLFIVAVFAAVSFISSESLFFMAYPTIMFGILPVTLISYDERFHWPAYAGTLPLRRRDEVREKYLLSLLLIAVMGILMTALQAIAVLRSGSALAEGFVMMLWACSSSA